MNTIRIFAEHPELYESLADFFVEEYKKAIEAKGRFSIVLSGGSTPYAFYRVLTTEKYISTIDWSKIFVFWGDERDLPETDENNNSFQARKNFLNLVPIPEKNIFPVKVELGPEKAAKNYEESILNYFQNEKPSFDFCLQGMGDDGHTASLFPGSPLLKDTSGLVKWLYVEKMKMNRITLTADLINASKNIIFLVTGANKADMLVNVLHGEYLPNEYPSQIIKATNGGKLIWYLDKEAAQKLRK